MELGAPQIFGETQGVSLQCPARAPPRYQSLAWMIMGFKWSPSTWEDDWRNLGLPGQLAQKGGRGGLDIWERIYVCNTLYIYVERERIHYKYVYYIYIYTHIIHIHLRSHIIMSFQFISETWTVNDLHLPWLSPDQSHQGAETLRGTHQIQASQNLVMNQLSCTIMNKPYS